MQQSLFDKFDTESTKKKELIISKKKQEPLNKQQIAFNKLIKKIETLREELKNISASLDKQLIYYGKEIHPLEIKTNAARKEILKLIFPQFKTNKKIKGAEKKTLKRFILSFLGDIFSNDANPPEQDLKDIYSAVSGESFEEAIDYEFEIMKEELQDMFRENGFEYDSSDFNKDMSQEEVIARIKELSEKMNDYQEENRAKQSNRKKTAKQLEKEVKNKELAEIRYKNIKSIYKQLVKTLHPDLEQDENLKVKKEMLMQRLTVAYENKDLHEILSLEMEFIDKEENNIAKLTKDKLAIYNQVLKEQLQNLQMQIQILISHPRFLPLMKYDRLGDQITFNLKAEKVNLIQMNESLEVSLKKLKSKSLLTEIRQIIYHFEMSEWNFFEEEDEEEDIYDWNEMDKKWKH